MSRSLVVLALLASVGCAPKPVEAPLPDREGDLAAARALFMRNIEAIQRKDRDAYLACYRSDEGLVRSGPGGPKLGFAELASGTSSTTKGWPQTLEASDVQVHWLGPGSVYGSYRYRVVFDGAASEGLSERVFAHRDGRWQIVVSTAFGAPASSDPRLADVAFMEGTWVEQKDGAWTEETWSPSRGGTMLGSGRTIIDGRTQSFEHMRIEHGEAGIELVAMPQGQGPVRFRLVEHAPGAATFANPAHDFPQRIQYRRADGKLVARVEGGGKSMEWTYLAQ